MTLKVTDAKWIQRDGNLYIQYKDEYVQTRFRRPLIKPYFFVRVSQISKLDKVRNLIDSTEIGSFVAAEGHNPCIKVQCKVPSDVKIARDTLYGLGADTFESDIPFVRRWMIDEEVEPYETPNILFFDAEADARTGFPRPENPNCRIISIAGVDSKGNELFICESDEALLFDKFFRLIERYPVRCGWYSNKWDVPYMSARAAKIGKYFPVHDGAWIDLRDLLKYSMYASFTSLKLDYVAQRILGKGKSLSLYKEGGAELLWSFFANDRKKLYEYNVTDASLTKEIEDEVNLLAGRIYLARKARLPYAKMAVTSARVENLGLIQALKQDPRPVFIFHPHDAFGKPYEGAYVKQPPRGVFKGVVVLDYKALYPSLIESFNMGVDTVVDAMEQGDYITSPVEAKFMKTPRSIFASVIIELKKLRAEHIKARDAAKYGSKEWKQHHVFQTEVKLASNSIYGVIGAPFMTKFYDIRVASAITAYGRDILKKSMELCEKDHKLRVLYADTDGFFVASPKGVSNPVKWCKDNIGNIAQDIEQKVCEWALETWNVPKEYLVLQLKEDCTFEKIYFSGAKKRYIGVYPIEDKDKYIDDYYLPDLHDVMLKGQRGQIKGYEAKKYNIFPLYKQMQLRCFEVLMDAETNMEVYYKVARMLRSLEALIYGKMLDKLLMQQVTPQKLWHDYKAHPPYWESLRRLSIEGKIRPGNAIDYYIIDRVDGKEVGEIVLDGMERPTIKKGGYDHYWELVKTMAERITGFKIAIHDRLMEEFT
jgi:DNA polymerase elongation subunit (family B)